MFQTKLAVCKTGVFIVFSERAKRAERTQRLFSLFEFWVCSKFGFVRIFWIWFVVSAERVKRAESTRKLLDLFNFWVCSYFLHLVCCFSGASVISGAHSETFAFVRILSLWVFYDKR